MKKTIFRFTLIIFSLSTICHFHLGKDVARYRESYISYLHYKDNGEMVTDTNFLDKHFAFGVGQYDADWDKIQAEWYMKADKVEKKESLNGGFEIQNIKNDGSLYFPNVYNLESKKSMVFNVSALADAKIEVRANSKDGKLLGICNINKTEELGSYKTITCNLLDTDGVKNIYLNFKIQKEDALHLDWFSFNISKKTI